MQWEVLEDSEANSAVIVQIRTPSPQRKDDDKFPREHGKTLLAFGLFACSLLMNTVSLALVHERVPDRTRVGPLPDVFFDAVPAEDWALDVCEILLLLSMFSCLLILSLHQYWFIIFRRMFFMLSILYGIRSITMYVTVLPVSSTTYYCSPKMNETNSAIIILRAFRMMSGLGLSINGNQTYCGDYIYSGHTLTLTMAYLLIQEYTPKKWPLLHWLYFVNGCAAVFFMMMAHFHYTVDVILAYLFTTHIFWIYHTLANNIPLKQRGAFNYLSRLWWYRIFLYFECNVNDVVPCQFRIFSIRRRKYLTKLDS